MAAQNRRNVNGIVLLDKPVGRSSNDALQVVKKLFNARKAGHTGSLDPLASGLLPLCMGEATKFSGFLLNASKRYRFVCRLGVTTTTGDAEGDIVQVRTPGRWERAAVESVLAGFVGEIQQLPPMYSALKHEGKRLYVLARQGVAVERQPRQVTIQGLTLLSLQGDRLECQVSCSKGTYVRTLAEDLGEALGCGAHIVELRRTAVGFYDVAQAVSLEALREQASQGFEALDTLLQPVDSALRTWPAVSVQADLACLLRRGQAILVPHSSVQGRVRLYERDGMRFLGIGEILDDGRVAPRRLVQGS